ncbi:hypothetical protein GIB67_034592, partial [Kingdonia uniflora]
MHMPEGDPHPSTLPGCRGTRDPEYFVTRSRSGRKKRRVKFEDIQPQDIPNPTEDYFPRRCITQLSDGVNHIYYTGNELTVPYDDTWFILSNARQLLPNIDFSHIKSGNVSITHLRTYLTVAVDREDDITITHAFILFMMGHLWFQTANNTVPLGYLAAVNDLDSAAQYYRGSAILASLYHGLDTAVTTGGSITGFVQLLTYWFYEYCRVGHPIVKEEVTDEVHIPLDPPLNMLSHISPVALHEMRQAGFLDYSERMGNIDLFEPTALRVGIKLVVVTPVSVHSLSQDFNLPGEAEGPDPGWHMDGQDESAWGTQRLQEVEDVLAIARRQIDSIDHQLYSHDLQLRRGRNLRVVPLPPEGGARTRQRRSGLQTRGG